MITLLYVILYLKIFSIISCPESGTVIAIEPKSIARPTTSVDAEIKIVAEISTFLVILPTSHTFDIT